jgi:hypothetical protein
MNGARANACSLPPMNRPGLAHIPTARLEALLRAALGEVVAVPLTPQGLMLGGFQDIYDQLGALAGLDRTAVRACLVIALAERRRG